MSMRVRIALPDRPGSLARVTRALGASGADILQLVVLEREAGRALDDIVVAWPAGAPVRRLCEGLEAVPGVRLLGVWRTDGYDPTYSDAQALGRLAHNPAIGMAALVDALPGMFGADWAALLMAGESDGEGLVPVYMSPRAPRDLVPPRLATPRARALEGAGGDRYALAPTGGDGSMLLVSRTSAPPFHRTEVERLAQLGTAATAILYGRALTTPTLPPAVTTR